MSNNIDIKEKIKELKERGVFPYQEEASRFLCASLIFAMLPKVYQDVINIVFFVENKEVQYLQIFNDIFFMLIILYLILFFFNIAQNKFYFNIKRGLFPFINKLINPYKESSLYKALINVFISFLSLAIALLASYIMFLFGKFLLSSKGGSLYFAYMKSICYLLSLICSLIFLVLFLLNRYKYLKKAREVTL